MTPVRRGCRRACQRDPNRCNPVPARSRPHHDTPHRDERGWHVGTTLEAMGTTRDRHSDKDADFSAYMAARQVALYRTAYLLAGDHAGAEDLLQNAFAKLYLSWDKVRDREALDGYVRRIMVNENSSLWRRAWKRREHSTDTLPETGVADTYDDGMGGRAVVVRADPPAAAALGGRPALLRAAQRGRDRRRPRHLRRDGQVPGQPGPRRAARPRARSHCTPTSPEATRDEPHPPRGPGPRRPAPPGRPPPARPLHRHRRTPSRAPHPARQGGRRRRRRRRGARRRRPVRARRHRPHAAHRCAARDPDPPRRWSSQAP